MCNRGNKSICVHQSKLFRPGSPCVVGRRRSGANRLVFMIFDDISPPLVVVIVKSSMFLCSWRCWKLKYEGNFWCEVFKSLCNSVMRVEIFLLCEQCYFLVKYPSVTILRSLYLWIKRPKISFQFIIIILLSVYNPAIYNQCASQRPKEWCEPMSKEVVFVIFLSPSPSPTPSPSLLQFHSKWS